MKPDSTSYENILEVENWGSQLSTFYKIMSPVQITLESCTGLGETDQYSILGQSALYLLQDHVPGADHAGVLYRSGRNRPIQHSDVLTEWLLAA